MDRRPLLVIAGPTASGKSRLAVRLAQALGGTVINADAMQVYRDLRVLTARPNAVDEAIAPHRLFGHIDGAVAHSAAAWAAEARGAVAAAALPIVVGGSGLYLRTLLDGIAPVPPIAAAIRAEVRALPVAAAHAWLARVDPAGAARLAPADTTRVARALEVALATERPLADWQRDRSGGIGGDHDVRGIVLTPDRAELGVAIAQRAAAMLADARDEVAALLARRLDPTLPVMRAIGVAAVGAHLAGGATDAEAADRIALESRRYAKRQDTWFRHQAPPGWQRTADPAAAFDFMSTLTGPPTSTRLAARD